MSGATPVNPFLAPVGTVSYLVPLPLFVVPGAPHGLPPLFRTTVTGPFSGVDEMWVPERARWESTRSLEADRSGRADTDLEVVSEEDAERLIAAHALLLAQQDGA